MLHTHKKIPNSGFTPGTPVFTHFTSARRRYALVTQKDRQKIERVTEMDKKNVLIKKVEPPRYYSNSIKGLLARPVAKRVRVRLTGSDQLVITTL